MRPDVIESKIERIPFSSCWYWTGALHEGYGWVTAGGKQWLAHRLAYEIAKGAIPDKLLVCHTCDVRSCVNPAHLYVGTHSDNAADKSNRNASIAEPRLFRRRFSPAIEAEMIALKDSGMQLRAIAKKFGCSLFLVWRITSEVQGSKRGTYRKSKSTNVT